MKYIVLTQDKVAIVDDEDHLNLSFMSWHAWYNKNNSKFYAHHSVYQKNENPTIIRMHHHVLSIIDPEVQVDHINGNTLDNRKENLRLCNHAQNARNRTRVHKLNSSGFRGVSKSSSNKTNPWIAQIQINGKRKNLGYFPTPEEAAKAFDKAAKEIYGEFCGRLNFE